MKLAPLAVFDPATGRSSMCTWDGATRHVVVTGFPEIQVNLRGVDLPAGAEVHQVPEGASYRDARDFARTLGGVLVTIFADDVST